MSARVDVCIVELAVLMWRSVCVFRGESAGAVDASPSRTSGRSLQPLLKLLLCNFRCLNVISGSVDTSMRRGPRSAKLAAMKVPMARSQLSHRPSQSPAVNRADSRAFQLLLPPW